MFFNELYYLSIFGIFTFLAKKIFEQFNTNKIANLLGKNLMSLPRALMMILMAIPEQLVLASMEPKLSLIKRISVSIAMYVIHFAWNGMVMKPERSYNELVWVIGTALYGIMAVGIKNSTAIALVAADSVMTLSLRGLA